jgi:hypothetical protein
MKINICIDCKHSFQCNLCSNHERHCKQDKPHFKKNELKYPVHSKKTTCSKYKKNEE